MCMGMQCGMFGLAKVALILTVSFFVLLAANKSDSKGMKTFGLVIAILLWISAAMGLLGRNYMTGKMGMMSGKGCPAMMDKMQQPEEPSMKK